MIGLHVQLLDQLTVDGFDHLAYLVVAMALVDGGFDRLVCTQ